MNRNNPAAAENALTGSKKGADCMISVAHRMETLHKSVFTSLLQEKEQYESSTGLQVLDFSLGSPDIPPGRQIIETMVEAVSRPASYKYAVRALPEMIQAIQNWYHHRYHVSLQSSQIALLQGSQEALVNLPLIFCNPHDIVLIPDPYYPIYADAPKLAGADLYYMPLRQENGYLADIDAIPEDIRRKARLMIVCYPNNPTGACAPEWYLLKLIRFARENNILLVYDNAYSELVYTDRPGGSFLALPGAMDVAVEINSFSKTYGMAGARLGVLLGNEKVIEAYAALKSNMDYGVFLPIQYAGIEALKTGQSLVESTRKEYLARRDLLTELFSAAGWDLPVPDASMFIWARIPTGYSDSLAFCHDLLRRTGILVTPGTSFGKEGEGYVRLALVQNQDVIREAARRLKQSGFFAS